MTGCAFRFLQATTKGTAEKRTARYSRSLYRTFSETGKHRSEQTRSSCVTVGDSGRTGKFRVLGTDSSAHTSVLRKTPSRTGRKEEPPRPAGTGNGEPAAGHRNPAGTHRTARLRKAGRVRRGEYAPTAGRARPGSRAPRPPVRCGASPRYAALPAHSLRGTRRR